MQIRNQYVSYVKTFLVIIVIISIWTIFSIYCKKVQMQKDISDAVIRFHVIANSDAEEDQAVKYKVRDTILEKVQALMENVKTKEEAKEALSLELNTITETANEVLIKEGMDYRAKAVLEKTKFPVKTYGDLTFPAGDYEAVRILLGMGEGKNWWCVMFPTLCLVDGTCEEVPEESKEKLKDSLTAKEYKSLLKKKKNGITYEYKFRLEPWFSKIFS